MPGALEADAHSEFDDRDRGGAQLALKGLEPHGVDIFRRGHAEPGARGPRHMFGSAPAETHPGRDTFPHGPGFPDPPAGALKPVGHSGRQHLSSVGWRKKIHEIQQKPIQFPGGAGRSGQFGGPVAQPVELRRLQHPDLRQAGVGPWPKGIVRKIPVLKSPQMDGWKGKVDEVQRSTGKFFQAVQILRADENHRSCRQVEGCSVDVVAGVALKNPEHLGEPVRVLRHAPPVRAPIALKMKNLPGAEEFGKCQNDGHVNREEKNVRSGEDINSHYGVASATMKARLTTDQVAHYQREGYVIPQETIFPEEKFQKLKLHFDAKLAALPSDQRPEGMDVPHFKDPALFEWLFADEVLDLVEPIIGPDIALFSSHFICKPRGNGKRVPWHEDSAYWSTMLPASMNVVTVWFAIDPSRLENGCMQVIPRTHNTGKMGFSDYDPTDFTKNIFPTEVTKSQRDESKAVAIELEPNHASLHDARIIHGSEPNTSTLRRCGYTMRFMSSATLLSEKVREFHHIYLARGRDLANQPYADPTRSYEELLEARAAHGKNGH